MRARHWSFLGTGPMAWGPTQKPAVERGAVNCVFPESNMSAEPSQVNCTVTPPHAKGPLPFVLVEWRRESTATKITSSRAPRVITSP